MKKFFLIPVFIMVAILLVSGFACLLVWAFSKNAKQRQENCKKIATFAHVKEYRQKDYRCYLVVDGKLQVIDL